MIRPEHDKLRGVNLGGWLVLEKWITPSLFEGSAAKDEFTFMQEPGAMIKIEQHRNTFVKEADFRWLSENGVNAVRIPIGYWVFNGDGQHTPCITYLDRAVEMAGRYNIKVLIDLHAAKGSQNGNDHSGRIGKAKWFKDKDYQKETIILLKRIAERYEDASAVWGIELLNEPKLGLIKFFTLKRFYSEAYRELQGVARPGTHIVFSDSFMPRILSGTIKQSGDLPVAMDVHWYQFEKTNLVKHFKKMAKRPSDIARLQRRQPVIIGEWSGMLSHQTLAGLSAAEQAHLERKHLQQQLLAYESALGWFYWTYKTEGKGIWNFRDQVENGNLLLTP